MPALILYAIGLLAYFLCDVLVTSFMMPEQVVQWAQVRSLIGLSGIVCLIGLESVLIRSPQSSSRLLRRLLIQIPLLALPVAAVVHEIGYLESYAQAYFLAIGSAGTIALYQYYRSHHLRSMAQLTQQGWRIAAFFLVLFLIWQPETLPLGASVVWLLVLGLGISVLLFTRFPPSRLHPQDPEPMGDMYRIGVRFLVTSTFLGLAIYAEQLVIQAVGTIDDAARYFSHATYLLFPMGLVNGYLGFVLGPWVRDNHDRFIETLARRWHVILLIVLLYAILLHGVGLGAWWIMAPSVGEPDLGLRLTFLLTSIVITLYQLPSAYNGVFAQTRHHDALILAQVFALMCAFAVFWVLLRKLDVEPTLSVAAGAMTNWLLRTGFGMAVLFMISRHRMV